MFVWYFCVQSELFDFTYDRYIRSFEVLIYWNCIFFPKNKQPTHLIVLIAN